MRLVTLVLTLFLTTVGSTTLTAKELTAIPEIEMVDVPSGVFVMGLDESEAEHSYETPEHQVTLSDFRIGKFEKSTVCPRRLNGNMPQREATNPQDISISEVIIRTERHGISIIPTIDLMKSDY